MHVIGSICRGLQADTIGASLGNSGVLPRKTIIVEPCLYTL